MIGPVVTIDGHRLPRRPNIHYLGPRDYADLPRYIGGWDVALLPFARNETTRFISPTRTAAYLAAGRPVVSTSIRDVISPYGERGLVYIADTRDRHGAGLQCGPPRAGGVPPHARRRVPERHVVGSHAGA